VEVDRWAAMRRSERHSLEIVACCQPGGALWFEALSDGCGKWLASRLPRDRNAVIRR
jgi:hypothetical protein